MSDKLVIVADAKRAKFYEANGLKIKKRKVAFLRAQDLVAYHAVIQLRQGFYQKALTQSHFLDPHTELKRIELREFCREIARKLNLMYEMKRYDELILVATPKTLGGVYRNLTKKLKNIVSKKVPKELISATNDELERQIFNG